MVIFEHCVKRLRAGEGVLRGFFEQVKEFLFMRDEVKH
jgi:hypothetical protein